MANPGLGAKVKNTLLSWVRDVFDLLGDTLSAVLSKGFEIFCDVVALGLKPILRRMANEMAPPEGWPPEINRLLNIGETSEGESSLFSLAAILFGMVPAFIAGGMAPAQTYWAQGAFNLFPYAIPPVNELVLAYWRGKIGEGELRDLLKRQGYNSERQDIILRAVETLQTPQEFATAWLRGIMSDEEFGVSLKGLGYSNRAVEVFKQIAFYIPPVQDIIRMAIREVFNPALRQQLTLDAEYPALLTEWAHKQGLTEEWAGNYWAAHWELPAATMGFEMLHRGVIEQDELFMLLKALDIAPVWRDKLMAISYNPYTRVDIRRLYRTGVVGQDEVFKTYKDLGYDDEHAARLTEFTTLQAKEAEKDLTKAELLRGYGEGILAHDAVRSALLELGYDATEADYYLALEDVKLSSETTKYRIDIALTQYKAGTLDDAGLIQALGQLNIPADQQKAIVEKAKLQKQVKGLLPTREDVIRWYNSKTIDEGKARTILSTIGYSEDLIDLYLTEIPVAPSAGSVLRWYVNEYIDEQTARKYLKDLRYGDKEIDLLIEEAAAKAEALPKLPPLAEVKAWFQKEIITESDTKAYLVGMGYGDKEVGLFIKEWTPSEA
jgi:hypothetical protein